LEGRIRFTEELTPEWRGVSNLKVFKDGELARMYLTTTHFSSLVRKARVLSEDEDRLVLASTEGFISDMELASRPGIWLALSPEFGLALSPVVFRFIIGEHRDSEKQWRGDGYNFLLETRRSRDKKRTTITNKYKDRPRKQHRQLPEEPAKAELFDTVLSVGTKAELR